MKTARIAALVLAGLLLAAASAAPAKAANVSFDFFYSNLSPHGSWMVSGSYGNVWQPRIYRADWNPYYDGHWEYTDCGWTWVSDYDWGGVPYHYGTWVRDPRFGWVWVPGYVWGPSWVVFRSDADYVGWAPVPPDFTIGASFSSYSIDPSFYVFVPSRSFVHERVRTVIVPRTEVNIIVNKTRIVNNNITIVNNVVVNRGPDVRQIEQRSGRRIQEVPIERVRNVSQTSTVTRDEIRVDPARDRNRRVAEPAKGTIEEARAKSRTSRENAPGDTSDRQAGRGRRSTDREDAAPAPAAPSTQSPDTARDARGRQRRNPPPETTTTAPSTQTPDENRDARTRNRRNRPTETATPSPDTSSTDTPNRARRSRRTEPDAAAAPEPTQPQPRTRPRGRDRVAPDQTPPPTQPPRVRPEQPLPPPENPRRVQPTDPNANGTSVRQPVRTEKGKDTKGKKKAKPPAEDTEEPKK